MKLTGTVLQVAPAMYIGKPRTFTSMDGRTFEVWNVGFVLKPQEHDARYRDCFMAEYCREQKEGLAKPFRDLEGTDREVVADVFMEMMRHGGKYFNRIRILGIDIKAE
jgi:hypothetical protein